MQEAYRVGVAIALQGDVATVIQALIPKFEQLDRAIGRSQARVDGLVAAMKQLTMQGSAFADSWSRAASSIDRSAATIRTAAAAARTATGSIVQPGFRPPEAHPGTSAIEAAITAAASAAAMAVAQATEQSAAAALQAGRASPYVSGSRAMVPYRGNSVVPYWNGNRDFDLQGLPYTPYGSYGPGRPPAGPGSSLAPFGSAIHGFTRPEGEAPAAGGTGGGYHPPSAGPPAGPPAKDPRFDLVNPYKDVPYGYRPPAGSIPEFNAIGAIPAWMGLHWMAGNYRQAASFDAEKARLMAQGFTRQEADRAAENASAIQQNVPGISEPAALHLANKLMNVTQDKSVALDRDVLTEYAKLSVVLSGVGKEDELHELDAAIRAGEFRGALVHRNAEGKEEIDQKGLSEFLNEMAAASVVSGGDLGPAKFLQYLRAGGVAGTLTSMQELTRSMALQIALGSSKAGTSLQGFAQQFTAGRMSEAAANLLIEMGIISGGGEAKSNPNLTKMGMGQFMLRPGALPANMFELASSDPSQFILQDLLPKIQEKLKQVYGSAYVDADEKGKLRYETALASQLASRIPGGVEMAEVIRNSLLMARDAEAVERALKVDQFRIQQEQNPQTQLRAFGSAYQAFQIQLGESTMQPAIQGLNNLSGGLNKLSAWAGHEPGTTITRAALEGLATALTMLGGAGVIAVLTTLGGATGVLVGIGVGAAAAVEGLKALDGWLRGAFPKFMGTAEQDKAIHDNIRKNGIQMPWWAPLPAGPGGREERPGWAKWWHLFSVGDANAATPSAAAPGSQARPAAPIAAPADDKGTASNPVVVHVQNQLSANDIATGVTSNQASRMNRPPSGYTGHDPRIDPLSPFYGVVGP